MRWSLGRVQALNGCKPRLKRERERDRQIEREREEKIEREEKWQHEQNRAKPFPNAQKWKCAAGKRPCSSQAHALPIPRCQTCNGFPKSLKWTAHGTPWNLKHACYQCCLCDMDSEPLPKTHGRWRYMRYKIWTLEAPIENENTRGLSKTPETRPV